MSNLKRIRENAGLSQSRLATLSGVSLPMIQKYEAGIRDINAAQAQTLYKLAYILVCNIEDLLEHEKIDMLKPE
jgi:transcriptional regulator with XRE-family HTH domain